MPSATPTVDDALKAKLADYLGHLESAARQGGDFVAAQAPDVVHQMVAYNLAVAITWVVVGIAIVPLALWAARQCFRYAEKVDPGDTEGNALFSMFVFAVPSALSLLILLLNVPTVLKCWLAPKYFILEQIISLAK